MELSILNDQDGVFSVFCESVTYGKAGSASANYDIVVFGFDVGGAREDFSVFGGECGEEGDEGEG